MEFFPFLGLTNNQDVFTRLFLALAYLAITPPSIPSSCHLSSRAPLGSAPSSLHSAPYALQFPTSTLFMLRSSFPLFSPTLPLFPSLSFFQVFPHSPIGGRRKREEDVEESSFSFARSRLTHTPKEEQKPLSM